jgi:hypothetical protein
MSNGALIWSGPSELDGSPIMLIATGLKGRGSLNEKTGKMIQTWIIRSDISPVEAVKTGLDAAICGTCRHMGKVENGIRVLKRSCYVIVFQAPRSVFESFERGIYPAVTLDEARVLLAGRATRCGSYGDPAAVPLHVWQEILADAGAITGYTHAWRTTNPGLAQYCMASADTALEKLEAESKGFRAFRVKLASDPRLPGEVGCPAARENGQKTNCAACKACGGLSARARAGIVIDAHGNGASAFAASLAAA